MKTNTVLSILTCSAACLVSVATIASAKDAPAILIKDNEIERVFITSANDTLIEYKETANAINKTRSRMSDFSSIYIMEPQEFSEAMELYHSRDYKGAKEALKVVQTEFKSLTEVKGNYATLAGYYEMECERHLGNLDALETLRSKFIGDSLIHESHKQQLQLNASLWDAIRTEAWPRLLALKETFKGQKLTNSQRVQVAYGLGLAHEKSGQHIEALYAYNDVLVTDFGASENICQKALIGAIRTIKAHPDAQQSMRFFEEDKELYDASPGASLLQEGANLVDLWDLGYGNGKPIAEGIELKKYKVKTAAAAPPKDEKEKKEEPSKDSEKKPKSEKK